MRTSAKEVEALWPFGRKGAERVGEATIRAGAL
jgi:hypothetical protein